MLCNICISPQSYLVTGSRLAKIMRKARSVKMLKLNWIQALFQVRGRGAAGPRGRGVWTPGTSQPASPVQQLSWLMPLASPTRFSGVGPCGSRSYRSAGGWLASWHGVTFHPPFPPTRQEVRVVQGDAAGGRPVSKSTCRQGSSVKERVAKCKGLLLNQECRGARKALEIEGT